MWRRQRRLWWTFRRNSVDHPHWPSTPRLWTRVSSTKFPGGAITEDLTWTTNTSLSPRRHNSAYTFSAGWKKASLPSTHPHHVLQGYHWERADQLHHCLVRKLRCSRPQRPIQRTVNTAAKSLVSPLPLHPGHFPYTMLQQSKKVSWRTPPTPP